MNKMNKNINHAKNLQKLFKVLGFEYSIEDFLYQPRVDTITMIH